MKPLGLGIIGLHHQHPRWYFPLWSHLPEYRPLAIAESDSKFLNEQKDFYGLDTYTDYNEMLARDDIDVVINFLPHTKMPDCVEAAAKAGKHIIVEKPCGATLSDVERIAEIAGNYPHLKISAPYCWRNHPVSEKIKEIIESGLIGEITAVEARLNAGSAFRYVRDNCEWILDKNEGGAPMWNLGVHWIDYFRWTTGLEIADINGATSGPSGPPDRTIEDNAQAVFRFENDAVGLLDVSYSLSDDYPGKRDIYLAFRGTLGAISWSPAWQGFVDEFLLVSNHESAGDNKSQTIRVVSKEIPGYGGHMGWGWLKDFAKSIRDDRSPDVSMDDILQAVKVADAFYRSVDSGRRESI